MVELPVTRQCLTEMVSPRMAESGVPTKDVSGVPQPAAFARHFRKAVLLCRGGWEIQRAATLKGIVPNVGHIVREGQVHQGTAILKS